MVLLVFGSSNYHRKKRRLCGLATVLVALALQESSLAHEGKKSTKPERKLPAQVVTAAKAHYELGVSYHQQMFADLDQAIAEYEQAITLLDDFAEAHFHLGLSYHTKAKLGADDKVLYRKALKEYELYLTRLPKGPLAEKARLNIKAIKPRLR
jgi:tetratricopeptide (TPR) repeat protein